MRNIYKKTVIIPEFGDDKLKSYGKFMHFYNLIEQELIENMILLNKGNKAVGKYIKHIQNIRNFTSSDLLTELCNNKDIKLQKELNSIKGILVAFGKVRNILVHYWKFSPNKIKNIFLKLSGFCKMTYYFSDSEIEYLETCDDIWEFLIEKNQYDDYIYIRICDCIKMLLLNVFE